MPNMWQLGAKMIDTAKEVWDTVEMMIKVKEPLPEEYPLFHEGLILYTYLHLQQTSRRQMLFSEQRKRCCL